MRLAVVISSSYPESTQLGRLLQATEVASRVEQRLGEADVGFTVTTLPADRSLPEAMEHLLATVPEQPTTLLVYFCGYLACMGDRPPALVLDAQRLRAFSISRLAAMLERTSAASLLVLDVVAVTDQSRDAVDVAEMVYEVFATHAASAGVLVGARTHTGGEPSRSRFTTLITHSLDWLSALRGSLPVSVSELNELVLYGERKLFDYEATRFFPPRQEVELIPGGTRGHSAPHLELAGARHGELPPVAAGDAPAAQAGVPAEAPGEPQATAQLSSGPARGLTGATSQHGDTPLTGASPEPAMTEGARVPTVAAPGSAAPEPEGVAAPAPAGPDTGTAGVPGVAAASAEPLTEAGDAAAVEAPEATPQQEDVETTADAAAEAALEPPPETDAAFAPDRLAEPQPPSQESVVAQSRPELPTEPDREPAALTDPTHTMDAGSRPLVTTEPTHPIEPAARTEPEPPLQPELATTAGELERVDPAASNEPEGPAVADGRDASSEAAGAGIEPELGGPTPPQTISVQQAELEPPSPEPAGPTELERIEAQANLSASAAPVAVVESGTGPAYFSPTELTDHLAALTPQARRRVTIPDSDYEASAVAARPSPAVPQPEAAPAAQPEAAPTARLDTAPDTQPEAAPAARLDTAPTTQPEAAPAAQLDAAPTTDLASFATVPDTEQARLVRARARVTIPDWPPAEPDTGTGQPAETPGELHASSGRPWWALELAGDAGAAVSAAEPERHDAPAPEPDGEHARSDDQATTVERTAPEPTSSARQVGAAEPPSSAAPTHEQAPPSLMPPSLMPPPDSGTVEGSIELGDAFAAREQLQEALEHYRRALLLLGVERGPLRADIYVKVGDVQRRLGRGPQALNSYDKALGIDPLNLPALFWATEMLCELRDFGRVEGLQRRRLKALTDERSRVEVLEGIASLWLDHAHDLPRARDALNELIAVRPSDSNAFERLIPVLDALGSPAEAIAARRRLAFLLSEQPLRRADLLLEAARIAHKDLDNVEFAIDLAEQVLRASPQHEGALELLAELLEQTKRWPSLADVLETMLETSQEGERSLRLAKRIAELCRGELVDYDRAARALERAVAADALDVSLRDALVGLHWHRQDFSAALTHCRAAVALEPRNVDHYRRAYELFEKLGERDLAWTAASVLDHLGEAEINESLLADTHRPEGLPAAKATLTTEHWRERLLYPERDAALERVLELVAEDAIQYRIAVLGKEGRLFSADPSLREDTERSTTTLARALTWSSRLLGVDTPDLYVFPSVTNDIALVPAERPTVVASRAIGSGLGLPELAFLWARHVAVYRPEHTLLVFFPTLKELASLVLSAYLALDFTPNNLKGHDREVKKLAGRLRRKLTPEHAARLEEATGALSLASAGSHVLSWARSVELACVRAGLLACGDVGVAVRTTERFPISGQTSPDEQVGELMRFSVSAEYGKLRRLIGVSVSN